MARSSAVSSSAVRVVGSMGGRSRPRSAMTVVTSMSAGRAPRSRSAVICPGMSLADAVMTRRRRARRSTSFSRPVMPKSSRATRPSGWTKRFPPWRSPWKTPWSRAPSRKAMRAARRTASVSMPASRMDWASPQRKPSSRLHDEDPAGHQAGMGAGDDQGLLAGLGQDPGHVEHVLGLEPEVELLHDGLGEELDQGRAGWPGRPPGCGPPGAGPASSWRPGRCRTTWATVGRWTLMTTPSPVTQAGRVDLGDGGGGQGDGIDGGEELVEGAAQVLLDDRGGRRRRTRPAPGRAGAGTRRPAPRGRALRRRRGSGRA